MMNHEILGVAEIFGQNQTIIAFPPQWVALGTGARGRNSSKKGGAEETSPGPEGYYGQATWGGFDLETRPKHR